MIKVCVKPQVKIIVFNDAILPGMKLLRERKEMKYIYMIETNCPSKKRKKIYIKKNLVCMLQETLHIRLWLLVYANDNISCPWLTRVFVLTKSFICLWHTSMACILF